MSSQAILILGVVVAAVGLYLIFGFAEKAEQTTEVKADYKRKRMIGYVLVAAAVLVAGYGYYNQKPTVKRGNFPDARRGLSGGWYALDKAGSYESTIEGLE